jgi:hypothetical protein
MNKGLQIVKWTVVCVAMVMLFTYVTMLLWNWVVPSVFDGRVINFWQALGILVLSKILFGGWGGGGKGCRTHRYGRWQKRYQDKLSRMSPEDRERFKARMKDKWCSPAPSTPPQQ